MASTIAHEMAHMWFGDLVTMKWWEDSWLNESFADFMGYDVAGVAAGYTDAWTSAAITRKPAGYRADRRRSTHPIAEDTDKIVDVDTAFANFDMITYAKGNSALAQLGHWLGDEDFLAGVNKHLTAHAFGNADLAAFLDSLDSATDKDVRGWAEAWLRSTGFDTLRVTRDDDGVPVLTREGSRSHRITVSAYDDAMRLVDSRDVHLGDEPVRLRGLRRPRRRAELRRRDVRGRPPRRAVVGRDHRRPLLDRVAAHPRDAVVDGGRPVRVAGHRASATSSHWPTPTCARSPTRWSSRA